MEQWDAYDASFTRIPGQILLRGQPIPKGWYHLVCDVLVRNEAGEFLLTQRDKDKPNGLLWEASVGGSALLGESPLSCAARELEEETGLTTGCFQELGRLVHHRHQTLYVEYLFCAQGSPDAIRLQPGETVACQWLSPQLLHAFPHDLLLTHRVQAFLRNWELPGESLDSQ